MNKTMTVQLHDSYKIAFIGWNPFQYVQSKALAEAIPGSVFILEKRASNIEEFSDEILFNTSVPILVWNSSQIHKLDGIFDIIITQTSFSRIHLFQQTKIVMLQYSYAKESYNFGAWRSFADLILAYGDYSTEKMSYFAPTVSVGNPRYSKWHHDQFHTESRSKYSHLIDNNRKTILYMPTWGDLSSIDLFFDSIVKLELTYNLLIKPHHNTMILEKGRFEQYNRSHIHFLGIEDDGLELLSICDIVISDYSGAIFDAIYCEKPLVLLDLPDETLESIEKIDKYSPEITHRDVLGSRVSAPEELEEIVKEIENEHFEIIEKKNKIKDFFFEPGDKSIAQSINAINDLMKGKFIKSQMQTYTKDVNIKLFDMTMKFRKIKTKPKVLLIKRIKAKAKKIKKYFIKSKLPACYYQFTEDRNEISERWQCLHNIQQRIPRKSITLFRLSQILKKNKQTLTAYNFLCVATRNNTLTDLNKRLTFESEYGFGQNAENTFNKMLEYDTVKLLAYMDSLNRISIFIPNQQKNLINIRSEIGVELNKNILKENKDFDRNFQYLLSGRYLENIDNIFRDISKSKIKMNEESKNWYLKVKDVMDIGENTFFNTWLKVADKNENFDVLLGLDDGKVVDINSIVSSKNTVEVFIPPQIFWNPKEEKNNTSIIVDFLKEIYILLDQKNNFIIIPRHQYYVRKANPRTKGKVLSYHTYNEKNDENWMHLQDSTLSGHFSIDTKGFAGFSSIATDYQEIENTTANITDLILDKNYKYLYTKYIENNISKYTQKDEVFNYEGDYVFVALQIRTDIVSNLAYIDGVELVETVTKMYADTNTKVIVKRHPYCNSMAIQNSVEKLEKSGFLIQSNSSIHSIIDGAKVVYSVNSGVGLESLLHLKPVIITGHSDYSYGVCKLVKSKDELIEVIKQNDFHIDKRRILKFLYFYTNYYSLDKEKIKDKINIWLEE